MPNEDRIRTEVRRIADEVVVDTEVHLAAVLERRSPGGTPRRTLVPFAAAASVAALAVLAATLTGTLGGGGSDDYSDRAGGVLLDGTPEGTVPSVFGQTRESADALLADRGYEVRHREEVSCDPAGRPVGTDPAAGTPLGEGGTVTVLLSYQAANTDCAADLSRPWAFVDFATGRGPAPRFADQVVLFVDGERAGRLNGAEAASGEWGEGSALEILARATGRVRREGDSYAMPSLDVVTGTPPDSWCGVRTPRAVGDREAESLTVTFEEPVAQPRCPARVSVYRTGGAIDAVAAWSEGARGGASEPIPDVVGLSLEEARDRVTAAGYPATLEEHETCDPRSGVVEQAPTQQDIVDDLPDDERWTGPVTLVVEVPHTTRDCAALSAAADDFLRFARGGPPPVWAPEVRQLLGYTAWDTVTAAQADDRSSWSFCSGTAPKDCAASPLAVAAGAEVVDRDEYSEVSGPGGDAVCELIDRGGLPSDLIPTERQVVLYPRSIDSCDENWSVWLWIDDQGRITDVNLLVPRQ